MKKAVRNEEAEEVKPKAKNPIPKKKKPTASKTVKKKNVRED